MKLQLNEGIIEYCGVSNPCQCFSTTVNLTFNDITYFRGLTKWQRQRNNVKKKCRATGHGQIDAEIDSVLTSEKWKDFLKLQTRFYKYSFHNTMLIHHQMPTASYVCGFNKWIKEFECRVKKGAKAIKILAPRFIKVIDEDSEEEKSVLAGFKVVNVFDVSQTEVSVCPPSAMSYKGVTVRQLL